MGDYCYPAELTINEVATQIVCNDRKKKNIGKDFLVILQESIVTYKIAMLYEILNDKDKSFHHYSLKFESFDKKKEGWQNKPESRFVIDSKDHNAIEKLFSFLSLIINSELPNQAGVYKVITIEEFSKLSEIGDAGFNSIKDFISSIKNKNELTTILDPILKFLKGDSAYKDFILNALKKENLSKNDLDIISGRKEALDIFKLQLNDNQNWTEPEWQEYIESNNWILGYGLDYRFLKILQREAAVSNSDVDKKNEVHTDFLLGSRHFTVIVEFKLPSTKLFQKDQNRSKSWRLSNDLIDAVSQILAQKAEWQIKSNQINYTKDGKPIIQITIDPKAILIIGNSDQYSGDDREKKIKAKTFELFRRNCKDIEILTYDELFDRAYFIVNQKLYVETLNYMKDEIVDESPF